MFKKRQRQEAAEASMIQKLQKQHFTEPQSKGVLQQLAQAMSSALLVTGGLVLLIGMEVVYIKLSAKI